MVLQEFLEKMHWRFTEFKGYWKFLAIGQLILASLLKHAHNFLLVLGIVFLDAADSVDSYLTHEQYNDLEKKRRRERNQNNSQENDECAACIIKTIFYAIGIGLLGASFGCYIGSWVLIILSGMWAFKTDVEFYVDTLEDKRKVIDKLDRETRKGPTAFRLTRVHLSETEKRRKFEEDIQALKDRIVSIQTKFLLERFKRVHRNNKAMMDLCETLSKFPNQDSTIGIRAKNYAFSVFNAYADETVSKLVSERIADGRLHVQDDYSDQFCKDAICKAWCECWLSKFITEVCEKLTNDVLTDIVSNWGNDEANDTVKQHAKRMIETSPDETLDLVLVGGRPPAGDENV